MAGSPAARGCFLLCGKTSIPELGRAGTIALSLMILMCQDAKSGVNAASVSTEVSEKTQGIYISHPETSYFTE
jgi:hypothetical protein